MERLTTIIIALALAACSGGTGTTGDNTTTTTTTGVVETSSGATSAHIDSPCCDAMGGGGCGDDEIEACVCADLPSCCDTEWDDGCAQYVVNSGCAFCAGRSAACLDAEADCHKGDTQRCTTCQSECGKMGGLWAQAAAEGCGCVGGETPCSCSHFWCTTAGGAASLEGPVDGVCGGCAMLCEGVDEKLKIECQEYL